MGEFEPTLRLVIRCEEAHKSDGPTSNPEWDKFTEKVKARRKICSCATCGQDCYYDPKTPLIEGVPNVCSSCFMKFHDEGREDDLVLLAFAETERKGCSAS